MNWCPPRSRDRVRAPHNGPRKREGRNGIEAFHLEGPGRGHIRASHSITETLVHERTSSGLRLSERARSHLAGPVLCALSWGVLQHSHPRGVWGSPINASMASSIAAISRPLGGWRCFGLRREIDHIDDRASGRMRPVRVRNPQPRNIRAHPLHGDLTGTMSLNRRAVLFGDLLPPMHGGCLEAADARDFRRAAEFFDSDHSSILGVPNIICKACLPNY